MKKTFAMTSAMLALLAGQAQATSYTLTNLSPADEFSGYASGINNQGQALVQSYGWAQTVWDHGTATWLGPVEQPMQISNSGYVALTQGDGVMSFGIARWKDGVTTQLPTMGMSWARGVNNAGVVVGSDNHPQYSYGSQAASWSLDGNETLLPYLPGAPAGRALSGEAYAINDSGVAVGDSGYERPDAPYYHTQAVEWRNGTVTALDYLSPGMNKSQAFAINAGGLVVGYSEILVDGKVTTHAASWFNGVATDLGVLPGDTTSTAFAVNSRGQIVGTSSHGAVLWDHGQVIDLNQYLDQAWAAQGYVLMSARGINDHGDIVGAMYSPQTHLTLGYEMSPLDIAPVPEPESWAMLLAGVGLLGAIARRRRRA